MSSLKWSAAAARIAGAVIGARQPDALAAARDAISETLQDWDTRRDWRYTQIVAPDLAIAVGDTAFDLPTTFKKPYVAYLNTGKNPLWYIERGNWHRVFPGTTSTSKPQYYTLFNEASTGRADIFPTAGAADTLTVLYYKSITYSDSDEAVLDVPARWEGYILDGARARLTLAKNSQKSDKYFMLYEAGIKRAKEDDLRVPDQFVAFRPPDEMQVPPYWNPNSTWEATWGVGW